MFYSKEILTKRAGGFGVIWLAATLGPRSGSLKKLTRKEVNSVNVTQACDYLSAPPEPMALRLTSNLMVGITRVYNQQYTFYFSDVNNVYLNLQKSLAALKTTDLNLPVPEARIESITIPELDGDLPMERAFNMIDAQNPDTSFGWSTTHGASSTSMMSSQPSSVTASSAKEISLLNQTMSSFGGAFQVLDHFSENFTDVTKRTPAPHTRAPGHRRQPSLSSLLTHNTTTTNKDNDLNLPPPPMDDDDAFMNQPLLPTGQHEYDLNFDDIFGDVRQDHNNNNNRKRKHLDLGIPTPSNNNQFDEYDQNYIMDDDNPPPPQDDDDMYFNHPAQEEQENNPQHNQVPDVETDLFLQIDANGTGNGNRQVTGSSSSEIQARKKRRLHQKLIDTQIEIPNEVFGQMRLQVEAELDDLARAKFWKDHQEKEIQLARNWLRDPFMKNLVGMNPELCGLFPVYEFAKRKSGGGKKKGGTELVLDMNEDLRMLRQRQRLLANGMEIEEIELLMGNAVQNNNDNDEIHQQSTTIGGSLSNQDDNFNYYQDDNDMPPPPMDDMEIDDPEMVRAREARESSPTRNMPWNRRDTPSTNRSNNNTLPTGSIALLGSDDFVFEAPWKKKRASRGGEGEMTEDESSMLGPNDSPLAARQFGEENAPLFDGLDQPFQDMDLLTSATSAQLQQQQQQTTSVDRDAIEFLDYVKDIMTDAGTDYVYFDDIVPKETSRKATAANAFYNVLVLATRDLVKPVQEVAFGEICIEVC